MCMITVLLTDDPLEQLAALHQNGLAGCETEMCACGVWLREEAFVKSTLKHKMADAFKRGC